MSAFLFHPEASSDLTEIWSFIAEDNIDAADRVIDEIHETIHMLVRFPHQGPLRLDLTARPLRFPVVRQYLVAYAPDAKPLLIIAVLHGRRSPKLLAVVLKRRM